jgi:tol-pal system protein YbgF
MKLFKSSVLLTLLSLIPTLVLAQNVPVIDLNQNPNALAATTTASDPMQNRESLPVDQRIKLLEQQLSNLVQMNLPAKIDALQQQLQELNGQLEVQTHEVQMLSEQLKNPSPNTGTTAKPNISNENNTVAETPKAEVSEPVTTAAETTSPKTTDSTSTITETDSSAATESMTDKILQAETQVTSGATAAKPAASPEDEKKAYDAALDSVTKKDNAQSIQAFNNFLKNYPKGNYASNAHYWLGELYNMQDKKAAAAKEYVAVIKQFPSSAKVPDSLLKLGIIYSEQGKTDQATQAFQKLVKQYPNTPAAQKAKAQLQANKKMALLEATD